MTDRSEEDEDRTCNICGQGVVYRIATSDQFPLPRTSFLALNLRDELVEVTRCPGCKTTLSYDGTRGDHADDETEQYLSGASAPPSGWRRKRVK